MSEESNSTGRYDTDKPENETRRLSPDALGLEPMQGRGFVSGYVDMIVGEGGTEVPGFVATKNEILQLVRYWAAEIVAIDFMYFVSSCSGSAEWRTREFAYRRLDAISRLIGEEEVGKVFQQAEEVFGKGVDPRVWNIFTKGTQEEQERFQREMHGLSPNEET